MNEGIARTPQERADYMRACEAEAERLERIADDAARHGFDQEALGYRLDASHMRDCAAQARTALGLDGLTA
jgi:hypothetical protein